MIRRTGAKIQSNKPYYKNLHYSSVWAICSPAVTCRFCTQEGRYAKCLSVVMEDFSVYVGIAAGICTAVSLLPQLFKIIKEKKAEDLSYFMLFILLAGIGGWVYYGILKKDYPIIITNSFSFMVNSCIIGFSIKYKSKNAKP